MASESQRPDQSPRDILGLRGQPFGSTGGGDPSNSEGPADTRLRDPLRIRDAYDNLSPAQRKRFAALTGFDKITPDQQTRALAHECRRTMNGMLTFSGLTIGFAIVGIAVDFIGWPGFFYGLATLSATMVLVGYVIWRGERRELNDHIAAQATADHIKADLHGS